jgi:GxxExxY protein
MELTEITFQVRRAVFEVFNNLGPGLLETIYTGALFLELRNAGLKVERECAVEVFYKGKELGIGLRMDLLVENQVVIEVKSVEILHNVHKKQLLTYLKLSRKKVGFLVNFNEAFLRDKVSLIRIVNGL